MLPIATYGLGEALITVAWIFLFVFWIIILINIFSDLFRDHETSGFVKVLWILLLLAIPYFGAFIYLIIRGSGMRERAIAEQAEVQKQMGDYIREQAGNGPADQLEKLAKLHDSGKLTDDEYAKMKAAVTG